MIDDSIASIRRTVATIDLPATLRAVTRRPRIWRITEWPVASPNARGMRPRA
jgi:hypothetical protein